MKFNPSKARPFSCSDADGFWITVQRRSVAVRKNDRSLPMREDFCGVAGAEPLLAGYSEGTEFYAVSLVEEELPEHLEWVDLRDYIQRLDPGRRSAIARAVELIHWNREHRFCGACGKQTEIDSKSGARVCPACGMEFYPRLSPAIIVRITRGTEILLAHNRNFTTRRYSCIAGFVEAGEALEECVHREVFEEVGILVKDVRYFGSQSWPFPYSLIAGFTAEYAAGEIRPDGEEIDDAGWFAANTLPDLPPPGSISRELIDDYIGKFKV
jgi:NAD+ diphosphatase